MTLAEQLRAVFWLVRDTFAQSLASGIGWLLFGLSTVCILVCLSASVSGPTRLGPAGENPDFLPRFDREAADGHKLQQSGVAVAGGSLRLAFGAIRVPLARDCPSAVHFLQLVLAAGVADTLGLLLTLVWTAGFLPGFLDSRAVSVLLAKPISRSSLLLGKYVGVLSFVAAQAAYFVAGTWLALAIRTGVWDAVYLLRVPLLLLHFAIFFSFSLLLAVCTRSTVVCVFGSIAFWGVCWAINFGRHAVDVRLRPDHARLVFRARGLAGRHLLLAVPQARRPGPAGLRLLGGRQLFPRAAGRRPRRIALAVGAHVVGVHRLRALRGRASSFPRRITEFAPLSLRERVRVRALFLPSPFGRG